jgi:hypothetical protein
MSDPAFYREMTTQRHNEMLDRMPAVLEEAGLPPEMATKLVSKMRTASETILNEQFEAGIYSKLERQKLIAFADQLLNRQSSIPPDFDELYRRKAAIDDRLLTIRPRWWQRLICIAAVAYCGIALAGTFVWFNLTCVFMLMVMAFFGTTVSAHQLLRGLRGWRKHVAAVAILALGLAFLLWAGEGLWILARLAFDQFAELFHFGA